MDTIKLVCFDLNGTLIKENTWYNLNIAMGVTPEEDAELLELHKQGKISYVEGQKQLEQWYKTRGRATKERIVSVISKYTLVDGAFETINYFHKKGYTTAIVSGSTNTLVDDVAKRLGIAYAFTNNRFVFDEKGNLKEIVCEEDDSVFKVKTVETLCASLGIAVNQSAFVGDSDNDAGVFELTGRGITFVNSPVAPLAWKVVDNLFDIRGIL